MRIPLTGRDVTLLPRELYASDRPSATAQWVALGRALELERPPSQRIVSDEFAPVFLSSAGRATLATLRAALPAVHAAERRSLGGLGAYLLCRHRYIDEQLQRGLDDGVEQVLILGA